MKHLVFVSCLFSLITVLPGNHLGAGVLEENARGVRVTSTSGDPVAVETVRLELAGQDVRFPLSRETPFVIEARSGDIGATFNSHGGEIKVELLRGSEAVMVGVGHHVIVDQSGTGSTLEARMRVLR